MIRNGVAMSKAEILAELPNLSARERGEILEQLWRLEEAAGPTEREKAVLNEAQAAYDANPAAGSPWAEVEARLRARR
jgi:putative addiction module component (TIGR02574 family)